MDTLDGKEILITGGTGSLGIALTKKLLFQYNKIKGIRIYSRDEVKQSIFKQKLEKEFPNCKVAFLIGDVRDRQRLSLACQGVDVLFHTAAMKQVPVCEYNPLEATKTNISGAENVIYAAIKNKVKKVLNISTDKAVYPINLYGATKAVAEKLFLHANVYAKNTAFSICRYGNVANSRGSVIPLWRQQLEKNEKIKVTSTDMTRFWITLDQASTLILYCINHMQGQEIFIPVMPSFSINDLAYILTNGKSELIEICGVRQGEKTHECILTKQERRYIKHYTAINTQTNPQTQNHLPYIVHNPNFPYQGQNENTNITSKNNIMTIEQLRIKLNEI